MSTVAVEHSTMAIELHASQREAAAVAVIAFQTKAQLFALAEKRRYTVQE